MKKGSSIIKRTALAGALLNAMSGVVNAQTYSKIESVTYHDDSALWVLGQPASQSVTDPASGASYEVSRTEFDARAQPHRTYGYNKLQMTFEYNPDGTVVRASDGRTLTTHLGQWRRGVPQVVVHPTGEQQSAVVDDSGRITSVTNEAGSKTCYEYDVADRLAQITYPSEAQPGVCDTSQWHPVAIAYEHVVESEHGIPVGHWRRTEQVGNSRRRTYYDAMLRPLVEEEFDAADPVGTTRWTAKRYDSKGRLAFASYPRNPYESGATTYLDATGGRRTKYDALGRVTHVIQDSEHGELTTETRYLSGLQTAVINPRGHQTTSGYVAYDQPTYDQIAWSSRADGSVVEISRNIVNKPLWIRQRSADSSLAVTRQYRYDAFMQLCRTIEPETGSTVFAYDGSGNLEWSAAGLTLPLDNQCHQPTAVSSGRAMVREHDARNRLLEVRLPDNNGTQSFNYYADGSVKDITTLNDAGHATVVNAYVYNRRGMLTGEQVNQPGVPSWGIGYAFNAAGHLQGVRYPSTLYVDYAPNALGLPSRVASGDMVYASGISYYANSAIRQFTYGNGVTHTMHQNVRGLPAEVASDKSVLALSYRYDNNGNVNHIADHLRSNNSRWMEYDERDRLTAAGSPTFGGDHWHRFKYDAVDNLRSWTLGGKKDYADYYYEPNTNRLDGIRTSGREMIVGIGYDAQGNVNNKNGQLYTFDLGNRLRSVHGKETYRYDGHGRRTSATDDKGRTIFSIYSRDGQPLFQEDHRKAGVEVDEHVYLAGSLIAVRRRNYSTGSQEVRYQHTDALGSPVAVTNSAATVIEQTDYEPYGAVIGKEVQGVGYTGHVMDRSTGLVYMQQRYYDPDIGRFLSVDPVTANSGTGANFNRYWYANNNPYKFTDPDGRQSVPVTTSIPQDKLTRTDRAAISAGNRGQLLYEKAVARSGDQRAMDSYKSTKVEYRRELSPKAQAIQDAKGQGSEGIRAYREPGEAAITVLPGFAELGDNSMSFPDYHGMGLGQGGDATLFQVTGHEQGHVLDMANTQPHDREAAASDHSNQMKEHAPREIKRELQNR